MKQDIEVNTKTGLELLKELATIQSYSGEEEDMINFIIKNIIRCNIFYTLLCPHIPDSLTLVIRHQMAIPHCHFNGLMPHEFLDR